MSEKIQRLTDILKEAGAGKCDCWVCNGHRNVFAKAIYAEHVKPLEDALAKAEADKTVLAETLDKIVKIANQYFEDDMRLGAELIDDEVPKIRDILARVKREVAQ